MIYSDGLTTEQIKALPDKIKYQVVQQRMLESLNMIAKECDVTWQYHIAAVDIVVTDKQEAAP